MEAHDPFRRRAWFSLLRGIIVHSTVWRSHMATAKKKAAKKSAAKKPVAKKPAAKKPAKKAAKKPAAPKKPRKPNAAFMKPMNPSATLGAVIGTAPMPRTEV